MKKIFKIFALFLAVAMLCTAFVGCVNNPDKPGKTDEPTSTDAPYTGADTLVVGYQKFSGKFSPFFATTAYDQDVAGMVNVGLISTDREGNVVYKGIEGEKRTFNGTEYTYTGMSDVTETINEDGTVDYVVKLRDGVKFSDGQPLTIKDVLFTIYVYCDPTYTGSTTFSALPIVGMKEYLANMTPRGTLIFSDGPDKTSDLYTAEDAAAFWPAADKAGLKFAQDIIDSVNAQYGAYFPSYLNKTAEEVAATPGLQVVAGMALWGYGRCYEVGEDGKPLTEDVLDENGNPVLDEEGNVKKQRVYAGKFYSAVTDTTFDMNAGEYPDAKFYWNEILAAYGYDIAGISKEKAYDDGFQAYLDAELGDKADYYAAGVSTGESAANISGITIVGDNELHVKMEKFDAVAIYQLGITIAPLHYYGDASKFDVANNSFGFTKGDLASVKAKTSQPLGAGAYVFQDYKDGVVTFKRNENYFDGCPKITYIKFQETTDADMVPGVGSGTFDVANPSFNDAAVEGVKKANSNGELIGNVITTNTVDNLGYGYIGANATTVNVGGVADSAESKALRKAFATLFAVHREKNIYSYYKERAAVIQYPISNTSWAAPKPNDEGYALAYSKDVDGNAIYTANMTEDERNAAALQAAIGFFKKAGYTWDDAAKKFTAAPDGAKLEYEVIVPGDGVGDHPAYGILTDTKADLESIGITLNINDPSDSNILWNALDAGTQNFWTAAWGASVDPDMYQVYYSQNIVGIEGSSESNHYRIQDSHLDELILKARESADHDYRKAVYKECLEIIMDWGVEIPTYQRQNAIIFSTERVNISTLTPDITTFWGWMNDIQDLEMNPVKG